jgi:hypothetical protein
VPSKPLRLCRIAKPARLMALLLLWLCAGSARALTVQLLGVAPGSEEFVAALQSRLGPEHDVVTRPEAGADVVVALHDGVVAEARALQKPLLMLQPHPGSNPPGPRETVIYWAPSLSDQMRLAMQIMPGLRRVGLLVAPHDLARAQALRNVLVPQRIELVVREATPALLPRQVAELAAQTDVLLAPVDSQLFNRDNLKAVLLAAYRQNRVFIGPNPSYVRAGALASLHATPQTLADNVASAVRDHERDGKWPPPAQASRFDVITNPQVARALGVRLPDADLLTRQMQSEKVVPWP